MSILAILERGARHSETGCALVYNNQKTSYSSLIDKVTKIARHLVIRGAGKSSRIGVLSPNCPELVYAAYGALATGAAHVPLSFKNSWEDNLSLIDAMECDFVLYHVDAESMIEQFGSSGTERSVVLLSIEEMLSWADEGGDIRLPPAHPTDTVWLCPTGGTTGLSKGVIIPWSAMTSFISVFMAELPNETPPVALFGTPLTHGAGALMFGIVAQGGTVIIENGIHPEEFLAQIEKWKVTFTLLVPTALYAVLDGPTDRYDLSSLRHIIHGGAPTAVARKREALTTFGPVLYEIFAQTECHTFAVLCRPSERYVDGDIARGEFVSDELLSACGRPTIGTTIQILAPDGEPVAQGETGEICFLSNLSMLGYYKNPVETARSLRDGVVWTGDLGFIDDLGLLHVTGRSKDMIISGGFNIYPAEIEQVIQGLDGVADCAVLGVPDDYWGERLVAVVQAKSGVALDLDELKARIKSRLGSVKTPKDIHLWDTLPKTSVGKVSKKDISALLAARA